MPVKHVPTSAELVLTHQGVTVYRCYEDDDIDQPCKFIFSLDSDHCSANSPAAFDVRDLEVDSAARFRTDEPISPQADWSNLGLDEHEYRRSPYWQRNLDAWDRWRNVTQPALVLEVLVQAIDANILVP